MTDTLYPGWNLIGAPSVPMPASELTDIAEILAVYGYDSETGYYFSVDSIVPGLGYWVQAIDTVIIDMP